MTFPLSYVSGGYERIERLRALYERRAPDRVFAQMNVPAKALERFASRYEAAYTQRPDLRERAAFWDELLRELSAVEDDAIPAAYFSEMDQGLYGGLCGGEIQYMAHPENGWISSMVPPILRDWADLEKLTVDRDGEAYRYYLEALEVFVEAAAGKFGLSHFILIDGLNFVYELVGATATYMALEDHPEEVRQAIDFAFRLNAEVQRMFFEKVGLVEGGTCSNMGGWLPGRVLSESVDPFHMTSPRYFDNWGREAVERILGEFDGGVVHIHGNGRHLVEAVSTVKGLKAMGFFNDTGWPRAITVLAKLKERAGEMPLIADVTFEEFTAALERHELPGGVYYKVNEVPDASTANRWMERVREYRI